MHAEYVLHVVWSLHFGLCRHIRKLIQGHEILNINTDFHKVNIVFIVTEGRDISEDEDDEKRNAGKPSLSLT